MITTVSPLQWSTLAAGHRWVRGRELGIRAEVVKYTPADDPLGSFPPPSGWEDDWLLIGAEEPEKRMTWRFCYPDRDDPRMFLEFADIACDDREAMLHFANRHGLLGIGGYIDRIPTAGLVAFDRLEVWNYHVVRLREVVQVWQAWQNSDRRRLGQFFKWGPAEGDENCWYADEIAIRTSAGGTPPKKPLFGGRWPVSDPALQPTSDIIIVAACWLGSILDRRVQESAEVRFGTDPDSGRPAFVISPKRMLGALWLQFAQAVSGNKTFRRCARCNARFEDETATDKRKSRRNYCSDSCKTLAYRLRKQRALTLHIERLTPKQIAAQLAAEGMETDIETIKKWAGKPKR